MDDQIITPPEQAFPPTESPSSYSKMRKLFFVLCIALFFVIILYLIYHNGKSIYDNGV